MTKKLLMKDQRYNWHPCSQMKDYETFLPLVVSGAKGSYIHLSNGKKIIDAVSSWWCKSLGHQHPILKRALSKQVEQFEHVIFANTTNQTIVNLAEKLSQLSPGLNKIMYAGDGSSAVEIALKMCIQARIIRGEPHKTNFIALENGYHGETVGALSVSDVGLYKKPYGALLFDTHYLSLIPYVTGISDPRWSNCEKEWLIIEKQLSQYSENATAIIIEPIVQGAGGMKIYSQDFLRRLRQWTTKNNIYLIADEIMTGLYRTGKMLACDHAEITPDFLCLSKGLTSGWMPFSTVLTHQDIYALFYDDYHAGKAFLHSHTFSGNVLGACIALAVIKILSKKNISQQVEKIGKIMAENMQEIKENTHKIQNIRQLGAITAAELICEDKNRRIGFEFYQKAVELGALVRPLGNTLYWLPPLNTKTATLHQLKKITEQAIHALKF